MRLRDEMERGVDAAGASAGVPGEERTRVLASVRSLEEARIALDAGVDINDLKAPARGALGAVEPDAIFARPAREQIEPIRPRRGHEGAAHPELAAEPLGGGPARRNHDVALLNRGGL